MTRRHISTRERLRIFEAAGGICHLCGGKIGGTREAWEVSHVIPLAMGGEDGGGNLLPAHAKCHRAHTAAVDQPDIAKAKRREARHIGAKAPSRRPMAGGRQSAWKRKVSGEIVPRRESEMKWRMGRYTPIGELGSEIREIETQGIDWTGDETSPFHYSKIEVHGDGCRDIAAVILTALDTARRSAADE